jgi:Cu/Ag efflux protein CusF
MRLIFAVLILFLGGCSRSSEVRAEHHFPLTGKVISINAKERTAAVDAAAIPNFMEAMTMDYPIKSQSEFNSLHVGDQIAATVDVGDDGGYGLSHIKVQSPAK